jgi:hypothetical protein
VAAIAKKLGTPLMPWQRHVVDVALEINPKTGRLVYREVGLTVPRQSGKTSLMLAVAVHRALGFKTRQRIIYAAQTRNDARKKWEDGHVITLEHSDFAPLIRVRKNNGNEAILWQNGSHHAITANTEKAGHGMTLDLGIVDEAFAQIDDRLEQAFKPAMITRPEPQLWPVSTAGTPQSTYLRSKVDAGRARVEDGVTEGAAYFEWSAPEDADPTDRAVWRACMPALGHTISEDAIAADFATMKLLEFQRAYLNQWCDKNVHEPVIATELWTSLVDKRSSMVDPVSFAVDMTPERSHGSLAAAGKRADGLLHAEIVEHREGTGWLVDRIVELDKRWNPSGWLLDPASPAGSLIPALRDRDISPVLVGAREMAQACGAFYDAATNKKLRHLDQASLNAAVSGAKKRHVGDSWMWDRRDSVDVICPLVAVTLALHGIATYQPDEVVEPWVAYA